jgi:large subunit ribosomal protein L30
MGNNVENSNSPESFKEDRISNSLANKKLDDIKSNGSLTAVIRISGMVKVNKDIEDSLSRLRLRRKYSCVVINPGKDILGLIKKVKYYVAYGPISRETLIKLLKDRGKTIDGKKFDVEKAASDLINGKKLRDMGLKPFFRLHPPRKGINSKLQYPKGVLGNNKKDINKLIERML